MAGRGSRYANAGYSTPKPLIEIKGKPMLYHAFQSVKDVQYEKVIFIALREHEERYGVHELIKNKIVREFELVLLDDITEGQLCTVLKATPLVQPNQSILIAAADSYIESNIAEELKNCDADGLISVTNLAGEQWSFAKTNAKGEVVEVAEKKRISDYASTGIYYFKNRIKFEQLATELIQNKETTKGEYYIMPMYNKLIAEGAHIVLSHAKAMWDMGTPEAKMKFETYLNEINL
jgi:UDP-N-acetylglucosamine diphosphorylase / glucose-1-phosphate thymidylyltransferase / UDP-N-acetylgalactosamine diphosphorylase / glucosamine-1-phosphate N-acetyltransferase / galactosamine-1-phosphate N-acetyltransferase